MSRRATICGASTSAKASGGASAGGSGADGTRGVDERYVSSALRALEGIIAEAAAEAAAEGEAGEAESELALQEGDLSMEGGDRLRLLADRLSALRRASRAGCAGVSNSFVVGCVTTCAARAPKRSVLSVSEAQSASAEHVTMSEVRALPPSAFCSSRVSFESRYGTWRSPARSASMT